MQLSRSTLERRFAKFLGRSPSTEIIRVQLQRVKELPRESDFPLAKIAQLAGFNHIESMCRLFKSSPFVRVHLCQQIDDLQQGFSGSLLFTHTD